ncbi:alpha-L-fucosidase [Pedobacter insulae]|uniref:alpha-L-fucosidase n=1 Tax=Pedobacter insulae TaxID=414048 RepID=A0A1I2VUH1_9SPHI|nr:alpha-L-fucosidase [Pedobacter insulae]SFG91216.1 alpha-L-fucosidase [Pedobacter insulae]
MLHKKIIVIILVLCGLKAGAQSNQTQKMQWFADAKFGIFIHWGIYSVNGISESWAFYNNYLNHDAYMKQLNGFNAAKYNPQQWVQLIKESGAKYAIITTKHHDGVALWDSKAVNATTTIKHSAAKLDLISPFVSALKNVGLKTGLYYSLPDWSYQDYNVFTRETKRYDINKEPKRWDKFVNYYQTQLNELSAQFKPDLLWFDGNWEHSSTEWHTDQTRKSLLSYNPDLIINSRLDEHGDYETPEQGVPIVKPEGKYWELCYTMNDSWGYQPYDKKYKSTNMIIQTLVECLAMGGNLLLDIGPKADGTIVPEQLAILKGLGRWTKKHAEAIYGTIAGLPKGHFIGKTALSKDGKTLYLYLNHQDKSGVLLQGIRSKITQISVLGYAGKISHWRLENDNYLISIPDLAYDKDVTVIKVKLNEAIELSDPILGDISYQDALTKSTEPASLKIKRIAAACQKGLNPFKDSPLTVDGLNFNTGVNPLDQQVNDWVVKNVEALHKTRKGIEQGHFEGKTALSADLQTLFLFVEGKPNGPIAIKGLKNGISRIRVVGEGTMLDHSIYNKLYWSKVPGIIYIDIPKDRLDANLTVISVLLDSPIELYREKVTAIESN